MRKCEIEDCDYPVFGKKRCKKHYPKTAIKKLTERGAAKKEEKKKYNQELIDFYLDLWNKRADKNGNVKCFETDILMSHSVYKNNLCCYSHQIPKSKRKDLAKNEDNVLIVLPEIHAAWEADPKSCEKMYAYTQKLKKKYEKDLLLP
jgi:hypothetical protein